VCRLNCEIPWERVPYLSALEVCSRQGAYTNLRLPLPLPYLRTSCRPGWVRIRSCTRSDIRRSCWRRCVGSRGLPFDTRHTLSTTYATLVTTLHASINVNAWYQARRDGNAELSVGPISSTQPNLLQSKNFGPTNLPNPQPITQSNSIQPTTNLRVQGRQF